MLGTSTANILIHYHEIALKGKNRIFFEQKLVNNIMLALGKSAKIRRLPGRILVETESNLMEEARERLKNVFGISSFSPVLVVKTDIKAIEKGALRVLKAQQEKIFKIETRREYKQFPLNSPEISRRVGMYIEKTGAFTANIKEPKTIVRIEVLKNETFVYTKKINPAPFRAASDSAERCWIKGPGGLPAGVSGKMLVLISGGIDSPVAAYFMMKRGAEVNFLHFHSYPYTDKASIEKVGELIKILNKYQPKTKLFLAPIADFQKEAVKKTDQKYRVILYRRLMYKVAEAVAEKYGFKAVVSGDNLGQVASQTIENMAVIGEGIKLPILRPLVGFDKEEIIDMAKKIGTFAVSIEPHGDCCSVFLPKNPATKSRLEDVLREEKKINMRRWIEKVLQAIEIKNS